MDSRHLDAYFARKDNLADMARESAGHASSYRSFHVGCAIFASNGREYRIFRGANLMPVKGQTKVCAEQGALSAARANDFCLIIAIVVAGEAQRDGESEVLSSTLHPCGNCRRLLNSLQGIQKDTIVYTVGLRREDPTEEHEVQEILAIHSCKTANVR